jgi:hypothetical protein
MEFTRDVGAFIVVSMPNPDQQATAQDSTREDFSDYVAHLQLHMALQARNLVPGLSPKGDRRDALLYETQATIEKLVSRQSFVK